MGSENIEQFIKDNTNKENHEAPQIFNLQNNGDRNNLSELAAKGKIQKVLDDYQEQLKEYFQVINPTLVYTPDFETKFLEYLQSTQEKMPLWQQGTWVYFPWLFSLVHILEEEAFTKVRTARNRNLITEEEQKAFYNATIGIAGQSVGNSVALAIVLQGGAQHIRLADYDRLALSNTNRIRAGVESLGLLKGEMTSRQIYTLNPYAKIDIFSDGLSEENISSFFDGPPKLNIIIDEIDSIAIKFLIREHAKIRKIPVLMGADNGDNAIIDIERYDLDPQLQYFHGNLGEVTYEQLLNLDKFEIGRTITKMLGPENITVRMQQSLLQMGKTIVSWPQLGGAALLNGSAIAYCARKILAKEPLNDGRTILSLDEKFIPNYNNSNAVKERKKLSEEFKKILGL